MNVVVKQGNSYEVLHSYSSAKNFQEWCGRTSWQVARYRIRWLAVLHCWLRNSSEARQQRRLQSPRIQIYPKAE
jgi:hypothetical protein